MNARELTLALGGRWHGSYGLARCPAHEDGKPSLSTQDGKDGKLLFCCHAGCPQKAVLYALKRLGHWDGRPADRVPWTPPKAPPKRDTGRAFALEIWVRAGTAVGSPVASYLRLARGITLAPPPSLRYVANLKHVPSGQHFPAMVAGVQNGAGKVVAIHRTYLSPTGCGKAAVDSAKMALGPMEDGAVRLGPAVGVLGLAEGIETALSACQLFGIPTWAALGARMDRVALPESVSHAIVFGDRGAAGEAAAARAADAARRAGRTAEIRLPPRGLSDWNDELARCAHAG